MNINRGKMSKAQKVVLYGPEGIGKSSLAAQFPDPLFIDTEGSTGNMDVARFDKPSSWTMLNEQVLYVKQNRPCKTMIIDTIDWAERMAVDNICSTNQKASITDFGYGNGFLKLEEEFGRFLNLLQDVVDVGINVILTAHAKITKFEQPDEMGAYDRYELKLGNKTTAKTASLVKEWADMVLFINYKTYSVAADDSGRKYKAQGGARTIYTQHHPAWDAKNRHGLPMEIPLDYAQIAHIFEVPQQQAAPTQVTQTWSSMPTPEQQQYAPQTNLTGPALQQAAEYPGGAPQQAPTQQYQQPPVQQPPMQQTAQAETPPPVQQTPPPSQPQQQYEQAPSQQQEPTQQQQVELNPNLPVALRDLMMQGNVSEAEIQAVVGEQGYYTADTPMTNYAPDFINGVLIGAWQDVFAKILEYRERNLPF